MKSTKAVTLLTAAKRSITTARMILEILRETNDSSEAKDIEESLHSIDTQMIDLWSTMLGPCEICGQPATHIEASAKTQTAQALCDEHSSWNVR